MDSLHRTAIIGTTDSEHDFRYLVSLFLRYSERGLKQTVRVGLEQVIVWSKKIYLRCSQFPRRLPLFGFQQFCVLSYRAKTNVLIGIRTRRPRAQSRR